MKQLEILLNEKAIHYQGGIYHKTKLNLTYHSNHIEGNQLLLDRVRSILDTNTILANNVVVDDIIETVHHFHCIDMIIDNAKVELTEKFIKELHYTLKYNTSDSTKEWFKVG